MNPNLSGTPTRITQWENAESRFLSKSGDWDIIADTLNQKLYENWILNGDGIASDTSSIKDSDLIISVYPYLGDAHFCFIPNANIEFYLTIRLSSGHYTASYDIYNLSGDSIQTSVNYQNSFNFYLTFKQNSTDYLYRNNTEQSGFNSSYNYFVRSQEYPVLNDRVYYTGLLHTFRDNPYLSYNQLYYKNTNMSQYRRGTFGLLYSVNSKTVSSGDSYPEPTPTTTPGSGEGGGITKEELTSGMIDANNQYWGTSGELTGEEQEETIENAINGLIEDTSGELSQNQAFEQLEQIENGFILFFDKNHDENWYDLKFSWENIGLDLYNLGDKYFIPGDTLNISKMCRDIPILGVIQTTIRTIFNFAICVMLIKQIWNLILATLGIDNPYLYEDPEEEHVNFGINENTRTMTRTIQRGKVRRWKSI